MFIIVIKVHLLCFKLSMLPHGVFTVRNSPAEVFLELN